MIDEPQSAIALLQLIVGVHLHRGLNGLGIGAREDADTFHQFVIDVDLHGADVVAGALGNIVKRTIAAGTWAPERGMSFASAFTWM